MTSLQQSTKPEDIANQYILEWRTPQKANKVLILVEGPDDYEFYYRFFNYTNSEIKHSNGCGNIMRIFSLIQGMILNNIAIKDSDFARLCAMSPPVSNFFYADAHDYEMMCLKHEETRRELFGVLAMDYDESICESIFQELKLLSFFKWYNYLHHLNYKFKAFKVANYTAEQLNDFDYIHDEISSFSQPKRSVSASEMEEFQSKNSACCKFELTNGHDFINRLCKYLKDIRREFNKENEISIKHRLHPCFRLNAFAQTDLYQAILQWEEHQGVDFLNKIHH